MVDIEATQHGVSETLNVLEQMKPFIQAHTQKTHDYVDLGFSCSSRRDKDEVKDPERQIRNICIYIYIYMLYF